MRLKLVVLVYGDLEEAAKRVASLRPFVTKRPWMMHSDSEAYDALCTLRSSDGYFDVVNAMPQWPRDFPSKLYRLRPNLLTRLRERDVEAWDRQLAGLEWRHNEFGAAYRRPTSLTLSKVDKHRPCDLVFADTGPNEVLVDSVLLARLSERAGIKLPTLPLLRLDASEYLDHRILSGTTFLARSGAHLADYSRSPDGVPFLRDVVALAYGRDQMNVSDATVYASETDEYGYPILLVHSTFKEGLESLGCRGARFEPVLDSTTPEYLHLRGLIGEAARKVTDSQSRFLRSDDWKRL